MTRKHYIIGTAGHIDHGKSTLVEALTGTDPDRLPEERSRGMTIDLGFAHLDIPDPDDPQSIFSLGVVDVPGHADFVKNMVAGVGSIDLVLIVIAVDDRWMPQTEEHLQIVEYLGVRRAVVALTKSDLVEDPRPAIEEVKTHLLDTPFASAPVVPVSAIGGEGLPELQVALANALRPLPSAADIGKPRLHVDRAFSPKGVGTVVTGTLSGGVLTKGQTAVIQPSGEKTTVRNLQSHNANVETAYPGMRTAVNLTDVGVSKQERKRVTRGDVITLPGLGKATRCLDVFVRRSSREIPGQPASTKPIKNGQRLRWHHGGASHSAKIVFSGKRQLLPGQSCLAQLRLEQPVYAYDGDRFVLRDWPKTSSLAGGIILDTTARPEAFRKDDHLAFLNKRAQEPHDVGIAALSLLERDHALPADTFLSQTSFAAKDVRQEIDRLRQVGTLTVAGVWLVHRPWWEHMVTEAGDAISAYHRNHPDAGGMPLGDLRTLLGKRFPAPELFDLLIDTLCAADYQRIGTALRHQNHRATLPPELRAAGDRILRELKSTGLEPPNPKELAPTPGDQKALRFLVDMGEVIDLGDKCALLAETFEQAKASVVAYLQANQKATVSQLRQTLGTTRRVLMPILDRLDKQGVTVRLDDFRMLSRSFLRRQSS